MNLKDYLNDDMDDDKAEQFTTDIIFQKFDQDKRKEWAEWLKNQHNLEREIGTKPEAKLFNLRWVFAIAASITLLAAFFFLLKAPSVPAHQQLAQTYIETLPIIADPSVFRKDDSEVDAIRLAANEAYVKQEFEQAIRLWNELIDKQMEKPQDLYYLGLSNLRNKEPNTDRAIELFTEAQLQLPNLRQEINWVLSLTYVQSGQEDLAKPILRSIISSKEYKASSARELLQALENQDKKEN